MDKAGNESDEMQISYYYTDASKAEDYIPTNVKVRKSYGKNVIYWNPVEIPDSIYYFVYRGEEKDFTPDTSNLVQAGVKILIAWIQGRAMERHTIIKSVQ